MINKSVKKVLKSQKHWDNINGLNLKQRPSEVTPEKYYEITELFEKN